MVVYRKLQKKIEKWLFKPQAIVLGGARQVGKTTLLNILRDTLKKEGYRTFFFNAENLFISGILNENPENLLPEIGFQKGVRHFVFIDEIQALENPSHFLKYLIDNYPVDLKFIVSGSAAFELKGKFQDSLVGRKVSFDLKGFSFFEFLGAKEYNLDSKSRLEKQRFPKLLEEYLTWGGLPDIVLESDRELKEKLLEEYVSTYIQRDVRALVDERNIIKFNQLLVFLSNGIGSLKNNNALAKSLQINNQTLLRYLDILESTFIFWSLPPYFTNVTKQIVKMKKVYCFDLGVRNAMLNAFGPFSLRGDQGALFENFIYLLLEEGYGRKNLFFFRTKQGAEVDFVIQKDGLELVEAKYQNLRTMTPGKGLISCLGHLSPTKAQLVNLSLNRTKFFHDIELNFQDVESFLSLLR